MARLWSSLASSYGAHFADRPQGRLRPLSTLTDRFADSEVAMGSLSSILPRPRCVRLAGNLGHANSVLKASGSARAQPSRRRLSRCWRSPRNKCRRRPSSWLLRVPGAAQHAFVMRCRPGIVTNSESGKAPDLRRITSLTLVLHRVRGTRLRARYPSPPICFRLIRRGSQSASVSVRKQFFHLQCALRARCDVMCVFPLSQTQASLANHS
jgi:hypothetical protein